MQARGRESCGAHRLWKASEIDSDQTLHMYIVKHDPFGTAKVVVGVSIAMHALLFASVHSLLHSQLMIFGKSACPFEILRFSKPARGETHFDV